MFLVQAIEFSLKDIFLSKNKRIHALLVGIILLATMIYVVILGIANGLEQYHLKQLEEDIGHWLSTIEIKPSRKEGYFSRKDIAFLESKFEKSVILLNEDIINIRANVSKKQQTEKNFLKYSVAFRQKDIPYLDLDLDIDARFTMPNIAGVWVNKKVLQDETLNLRNSKFLYIDFKGTPRSGYYDGIGVPIPIIGYFSDARRKYDYDFIFPEDFMRYIQKWNWYYGYQLQHYNRETPIQKCLWSFSSFQLKGFNKKIKKTREYEFLTRILFHEFSFAAISERKNSKDKKFDLHVKVGKNEVLLNRMSEIMESKLDVPGVKQRLLEAQTVITIKKLEKSNLQNLFQGRLLSALLRLNNYCLRNYNSSFTIEGTMEPVSAIYPKITDLNNMESHYNKALLSVKNIGKVKQVYEKLSANKNFSVRMEEETLQSIDIFINTKEIVSLVITYISVMMLILFSVLIFYASYNHTDRKITEVGLLKVLGLSNAKIFCLYIIEFIIISLLGISLAILIFKALIIPSLSGNIEFSLVLSQQDYCRILICGILGSCASIYPILRVIFMETSRSLNFYV